MRKEFLYEPLGLFFVFDPVYVFISFPPAHLPFCVMIVFPLNVLDKRFSIDFFAEVIGKKPVFEAEFVESFP